MLQFSILGFRVTVQPTFWITNLLFGLGLLQGPNGHWLLLLILFAVVFLSILWHELGHALAFRRFGVESEIVLYTFGGLAIPVGRRNLTRRQDIIVSAAGPLFQLLIGVPVWWGYKQGMFDDLIINRPFAWPVIWWMMLINLGWALANLVPVFPLDGGHICHSLLGPRREKLALQISLVCAAGASVACFSYKMVFGGIFFAMLAWNNWRRLNNDPEFPWMSGS
jgi:Zn-dependent protease